MNETNRPAPRGLVFDIQHFSVDDGPGIRATVFLKGCSLRCAWCHNPESIGQKADILAYPDRCDGCGACVAACSTGARRMDGSALRFDRMLCVRCGACAAVCPGRAAVLCGRHMAVEEVMAEIATDEYFCKDGGGVTFSGGEPTLQPEFLLAAATACRARGLSVAVDTAGNIPASSFSRPLLDAADLFLYDLKAVDGGLHRRLTGADSRLPLANLRMLHDAGKTLWVRIPFVHGATCSSEEIDRMAELLSGLPDVKRIELNPYHAYGESKYAALGIPWAIPPGNPPDKDAVAAVIGRFARRGIRVTCPSMGG